MNEVVDRVGEVVVAAARRRAARRRRRTATAVAALGVLLAASGASAVTGVGPLGDALTADEKLPIGAKPAPGGESVTLAAETSDGRRQEVRAYRRNPDQKGRLYDLEGGHHYCVASYSAGAGGRRDPISIICTLGTALAAKLVERRMWLECSSRGGVVGDPKFPDPVCGLTLADTTKVTIDPDRGRAGEVLLSRPFPLRVNHEPEIVGRESLDPERVRRLPRVLQVRAILGVVEAPMTQPGQHLPRVAVTATGPDGRQVTAHVQGQRLLTREDVPSMDPAPEPGGPRTTLTTDGAASGTWTMKAWRTRTRDHCASSAPASGPRPRDPSIFCVWRPELGRFRSLVQGETEAMFTRARPAAGGGYAVYGLVRADAESVRVRDPAGRTTAAELSPTWVAITRRKGDLQAIPKRFRGPFEDLPRSVLVRVFQAVLPSPPAPRNGRDLLITTTLADGRRAESRPLSTPRRGTSGLTPPPRP